MGTLRNTLLATLLVAGTGTAALAQTTDNGTAAQTPPAATAPAAPAPVAPAPGDNAVTANGTSGASSTADDRGSGWGWIGLVGLVGLAGLMRRPDRVRVGSYDAAPSDTYAPGSRTAP